MANLYEINKQIIELMDQWQMAWESEWDTILYPPMDFELEFGKLQLVFADKINNICKYMRNLETDNDGIDDEIARLSKIKQSNARKHERLKSYVASSLQSQGLEKTETDLFKLSFRRSTSLEIVDESKVPEQFKEKIESTKIDKTALKTWIISGTNDPQDFGCQTITKENLQIK